MKVCVSFCFIFFVTCDIFPHMARVFTSSITHLINHCELAIPSIVDNTSTHNIFPYSLTLKKLCSVLNYRDKIIFIVQCIL